MFGLSRFFGQSPDYSGANAQTRAKAMIDNAPIGGVGGFGGVQARPQQSNVRDMADVLAGAALATAPVPVLGDLVGLAADAVMYADKPETRTPANYGLSAAGLLPWVPPAVATAGGLAHMMSRGAPRSRLAMSMPRQAGSIGSTEASVYRGGAAGNAGEFFSRDAEYAKGFDKGEFGQHRVSASRTLKFDDVPIPAEDLMPIVRAMEAEGDDYAAKQLRQVLKEDGGMMGADLYQVMGVIGSASPEYYLRKAGIQAIDTGRDIRVLDPSAVQ